MYQENVVTTDGEWEEDELKGVVYDICIKIITPKLVDRYKYRAIIDADLLKYQYMAEQILCNTDVIELYNKHNDIDAYEQAITDIIHKMLEENTVK